MNILVIDDTPVNVTLCKSLIKKIPGCEAFGFSDGLQALAWCENHTPDLVLVDYMMPAPDGIEFIRIFRDIAGFQEIPVVMITALDDREIKYRALQIGATDFLTKPIDSTEFSARVKNLLTLRKHAKKLEDQAAWLKDEIAKATAELLHRELETITHLGKAAEFRDPETGAHIQRMSHYSACIARELGLGEEECRVILYAAPLHDIGKLGTPDAILLKPGKLTPEEFDIMKGHAKHGWEILRHSNSEIIQAGAMIAYTHHEKWDGSGYPRGLKGNDIPLHGRIVAVADVFDALTSERPYKKAWSVDESLKLLDEQTGKHFDPACVEAFMNSIEEILDIKERFKDET